MPFSPGQSGNPTGRPKGSINRFGARLLERNGRKILSQLIAKATSGDLRAIEICVDRLLPRLKPRMPAVELAVESQSLAEQGRAVVEAALGGMVDPDQAQALLVALSHQARIVEVGELEDRIRALEDRDGKPPFRVIRKRVPLLPETGAVA